MKNDGPSALDALDEYLSSDASPEECMQLSDLDGFLTGIIVGPELIMPSEWLPILWGEDPPVFENDDIAALILGAIMARYDEIVQALSADPPELEPIFWQTEDGLVIARDWAEGFMEAISLGPSEWREMLNDEDAGLPLAPIFLLAGNDETESASIGDADGDEVLLADAADLIPLSVIEIDAFWKFRRGLAADSKGTMH
jgi:uncharacterized protein